MKLFIGLTISLALFSSCDKVRHKAIDILSSPDDETVQVNRPGIIDVREEQPLPDTPAEDAPRRLHVSSARYDWSLAPQEGNSYEPRNLFDGNPATAWAVKLSQAPFDCDLLYGPTFTIDARQIDYIVFTNGYAKSTKSFRNNTRAARIIIARSDFDHEIDDPSEQAKVLYSGPVADISSPQTLSVNPAYRHIPGPQRFVICFEDFHHGDKYDDLCISEVAFFGK